MILPDDDIDGINLNRVSIPKSKETNDNDMNPQYKPVKQIVCKFFIPKVSLKKSMEKIFSLPNKAPMEKDNSQIKRTIVTDIDDGRMLNCDYLDSRVNDERISIFDSDHDVNKNGQEELGFIGNGIGNVLNLRSVVLSDLLKQESLVKKEKSLLSMQPPFSPSNSSQSNLPNTLGSFSKSSKSMTDSDTYYPETAQIPSNLIVKDVFSINDQNMSENVNTTLLSLDPYSKPSDHPISKETTSESKKVVEKKSQSKLTKKARKRSSHFSDYKYASRKKTRRLSSNPKSEKTNDIGQTSSDQSRLLVLSESDTDAMTEEITETRKTSFDSIEPFVVLDLLFMDKYLVEKSKREKSLSSTKTKSNKDKVKQTASNNKKAKKIETRIRESYKRKAKSEKLVPSEDNELSCDKKPDVLNNTSPRSEELIYCFSCKSNSRTFCQLHPVSWIKNENIRCPFVEYNIDESFDKYFIPKLSGVACKQCYCNKNKLEHLMMSIPKPFKLKESDKSDIAIWTKYRLNRGTIIGPYIGELTDCWRKEDARPIHSPPKDIYKNTDDLLCLQDVFKSNWLRFINFTNDKEKSNLRILQYDGKIFCQTIKKVNSNTELVVCKKLKFDSDEKRKKCFPKALFSCDKDDLVNRISINHPKSVKSSTGNSPTKPYAIVEKVTQETHIVSKKSQSSSNSSKVSPVNLFTKPCAIDENISKQTSVFLQQDNFISNSLQPSSGNSLLNECVADGNVSKETSVISRPIPCTPIPLKPSSENLIIEHVPSKPHVVNKKISKETSVVLQQKSGGPESLKHSPGNLPTKSCAVDDKASKGTSEISQQNICSPQSFKPSNVNLPTKQCIVDEKISKGTSVELHQNICCSKSIKPFMENLPTKPSAVDEKVSKGTSEISQQNTSKRKSFKPLNRNLPTKPCVVEMKVRKETSVMSQQNINSPKSLKSSSGNLSTKQCAVEEKMKLESKLHWQSRVDITTKETLNTDRQKHSDFDCISISQVPKIENEVNKQKTWNKSCQFDKEIIIYTAKLMSEMSTISTSKINELLSKEFPNKPKLSDQYVKKMIYDLKLRPLKGLSNNIDRDLIEALVEMFIDNPKMTISECQSVLMKLFPKKPRLSTKTIGRYLKLNNCRVKEEEISFTIDIDVLEEIKKVIDESKSVSVHFLFKEISQRFPHNQTITMQYIDYLVQTFQLKKKGSEVKFIEDRRVVDHQTNYNNPINNLPANKITVSRSLLNTESLVSQSTV